MQNSVVIPLSRAKPRVAAQIADRGEQLMQCEICTAVGKYYWCENSIHIYCDLCIADAKTPLAWYWVERMRRRLAPSQFRTIDALSMSSSSEFSVLGWQP